jgi:hypothetical protein
MEFCLSSPWNLQPNVLSEWCRPVLVRDGPPDALAIGQLFHRPASGEDGVATARSAVCCTRGQGWRISWRTRRGQEDFGPPAGRMRCRRYQRHAVAAATFRPSGLSRYSLTRQAPCGGGCAVRLDHNSSAFRRPALCSSPRTPVRPFPRSLHLNRHADDVIRRVGDPESLADFRVVIDV